MYKKLWETCFSKVFYFYTMKKININNKEYQKPLLVFAMKEEAVDLFDDYHLVFTGIGKVNATYTLTKAIQQYQPDIIINLGTAGSQTYSKGQVVCCHQFVQRDMDVSPLGIEKFKTPFSEEEIVLQYGIKLNHLMDGICGSGDSFETEHHHPEYNIVDMEAYALAWVAKQEGIPFMSLKYISDGADDAAVGDWKEEVHKAAKSLAQTLAQGL